MVFGVLAALLAPPDAYAWGVTPFESIRTVGVGPAYIRAAIPLDEGPVIQAYWEVDRSIRSEFDVGIDPHECGGWEVAHTLSEIELAYLWWRMSWEDRCDLQGPEAWQPSHLCVPTGVLLAPWYVLDIEVWRRTIDATFASALFLVRHARSEEVLPCNLRDRGLTDACVRISPLMVDQTATWVLCHPAVK
ncbi:hypothetical protein [Niveibacterium sp. SC-1]|uniref:hypothetical protein n=1 Tax=Niveibacterium sp. SC-1 TaxID=3135646 RepID=UPI00311D9DFA